MNETKKYIGSCHCGNVEYEVQAELSEGMACNCSICSRAGWVLFFVPEAQFKLLKGENATTGYQFGKKHTHHPFCTTCGIRSYSCGKAPDGSLMYAVNARCLRDFDLSSATVNEFDGAAL